MANDTVYLSYSCFETEIALLIAADLENAGFAVRTDATSSETRAGLLSSGVLIAFLSPSYLVARYAREELVLALRNRRPVIPIVVSPVQPSLLPANLPRQPLIDFTEWRDEQAYTDRFEQLTRALLETPVRQDVPPELEVRYLNSLIARLEMQRASLEYVDLSGEGESSDLETRPASRTADVWGIPSRISLTQNGRRNVDVFIETALTNTPRLVLLGEPGSGKSTLLARVVLDAAIARRASPSHHPLPLLVNLAVWPEQTPVETFIQSQWPLEGDALALLASGDIALYLDSLNEMGAESAHKLAALREWLHGDRAPQRVIVACRTRDYDESLQFPTLELDDMDEAAIERFVIAYVDNPSPLLAQIFPRSKEERELGSSLAMLARRPAFLMGLIFLYRSAAHTDLPRSVGALFKRLLAAHWVWKRMAQMPMWLPFKEMEAGYSTLALTMLDKNLPTSIPHALAAQILPDERFIQAGSHAGLLEARNGYVRFTYKMLQEYFAAVGLNRVDLVTRMRTPQFDIAGERLAGRWDQVVVMMAGIAANPDALVRDVAEIDPFLAGECVSSGVRVSDPVYDRVIISLTSFAQGLVQDGRMAATKALKAIGRKTIVPFLLELMRTGSWKARLAASEMLAENGAPIPPDLLTALRDWDWKMDDRVAVALRRVGTEAVPVLLSVLHDEHWERRRGAAWALGAIGDTAAVPVLVETLKDEDPLVRREAAVALRSMSDTAAVAPLLDALRDDDWRVRKAAAETMLSFKGAAVPGLVEALTDPRDDVRRASAEVLGRIGDKDALEPLLQLSRDPSSELRGAAISALGRLGSAEAVPRLVECLEDKARAQFEEREIRHLAAEALEQIGTREAKAAVTKWRQGLPLESQTRLPTISAGSNGDGKKLSLKQLLQKLSHSDWQQRMAAVQELSEIDEVPVVQALLKAIQDVEPQVRWAAVRALEGKSEPKVLKALLWALRDNAHLVSDAAAVALSRAGTPAVSGLIEALRDAKANVRGLAVEALGRIGDPQAVPALAALLSDEAVPQRETTRICDLVAGVLEQIGTPEALNALAQWRGVSAQTETSVPAEPDVPAAPETKWEALPHLLETLHNPNWGTRERAAKTMREQAKALRGLDEPFVVNLLAEALRDPDEFVRWAVVETLAWIKDDTTVPLLMEAMHDREWSVRLAVIRALIELGDSNVTPILLQALEDPHTPIREAAAEALGRIGHPSAVSGLVQALGGDKDGFVRRASAEALGELGSLSAVKPLIKALQDADTHVRWAAAEALGKIGDPAAVPALITKLNDSSGPSWEDRRICDVVADALESIGVPEAHAAVERWRNGSTLTTMGD